MKETVSSILAAGNLFLVSCASMPASTQAGLRGECPAAVVRRTDGLVPDHQSGVIAALWDDGEIVRAKDQRRAGGYVLGRVDQTQRAQLLALVKADVIWNAPVSEVALDMPGEELLLYRGDQRRGWAQTPGVTTTASIERVRAALFAVALENPSRLRGSVLETWNCPPATWR